MYIYNYFIILLSICVSYDTQFDTIHDTEKSKIDSRYDLRFNNYGFDNGMVMSTGRFGLQFGFSRITFILFF